VKTQRLRATVLACIAVASVSVAAAPLSASAAPAHHASRAHHSVSAHHSVRVRHYDTHLLAHTNIARIANHRHAYRMNTKLWKIAHAWAAHLAKTGVLEHNPKLVHDVGRSCPNWRSTGENVGVTYGTSVGQLFQAYMHSPPHRANILDKRYSEVGIATVQVVHNGLVEQWDVMDFGNRC
jgi:uncharacterized protein YkwD